MNIGLRFFLLTLFVVTNLLANPHSEADRKKLRTVYEQLNAEGGYIEISLIADEVSYRAPHGNVMAFYDDIATHQVRVYVRHAGGMSQTFVSKILKCPWLESEDLGIMARVRIRLLDIRKKELLSMFVHTHHGTFIIENTWHKLETMEGASLSDDITSYILKSIGDFKFESQDWSVR